MSKKSWTLSKEQKAQMQSELLACPNVWGAHWKIGQKYGVNRATVRYYIRKLGIPSPQHINKGHTCKYVGCDNPAMASGFCSNHRRRKVKHGDVGVNISHDLERRKPAHNLKLTPQQVREIRANHTDTLKVLAERYGVTPMNISCIKHYKTWKDLDAIEQQLDYNDQTEGK